VKYGLYLTLTAQLPDDADLLDKVDEVGEQLALLDARQRSVLDFGLAADVETKIVEAQVTVEAPTPEEAMALGLGLLRTAIHATGAGTPGWEDAAPSAATLVEFRLDEAATRPLVAA